MASGSNDGKHPDLPKGLTDRRGAPAGKARLPSLRGPRDLTLGGVQRKVFVPNIPVRKEKGKEEASGSKDQTDGKQGRKSRDHDSSRGRGHGRGRGRGRGQDNLIQIHSHFEQGPTGPRKGWGSSNDGGGGGGGGDRVSSAPRVKQENSKAGESASRNLEHLMRDDFVADGPADDPNLLPVMLPMCAMIKAEVKKDKVEKVSTGDGIVKEEPMDDTDAVSTTSSEKAISIASSSGRASPESDDGKEITCKQLLKKTAKSEKEQLIFLQLPDVLPGHPPTEILPAAPNSKGDEARHKDDKQADEDAHKPASCSLADFSEGYVGKLRVRRSGKTELVLGNIVLDVSMGTPCGFLQDVVSIRTDEDDSRMTVLGHLQHRMICTPNFESLLKFTFNS